MDLPPHPCCVQVRHQLWQSQDGGPADEWVGLPSSCVASPPCLCPPLPCCVQFRYGTDCSRKMAGLPMEPSSLPSTPWVAPAVGLAPPAWSGSGEGGGGGGEGGGDEDSGGSGGAGGGGRRTTRKRPFIFVYDLPTDYNARLLQYKIDPMACSWRTFEV